MPDPKPTPAQKIQAAAGNARASLLRALPLIGPKMRDPAFLRPAGVIATILLVLLLPFALRPREEAFTEDLDGKVVIMTPHHEAILSEFSRAFSTHMKTTTGKNIRVDWRVPGGTSEIAKLLNSEYRSAFELHWKRDLNRPWENSITSRFNDRKLPLPTSGETPTPAQEAKIKFLESDIGIGVDLFFGGGAYDFQIQAAKGHLVASDPTEKFGLAPLAKAHPAWFSEDTIPQASSGETFRDAQHRWAGTCLSSFGIVYNTDSLKRLFFEKPPSTWDDLGQPQYFGQIALADPTRSGSVAKAFEMLIQQQIQESITASGGEATQFQSKEQIITAAIQQGWDEGLQLIQRIGANARYFTDDATKIPRDVAAGLATAGMCIDFYGRTQAEALRQDDGTSRVGFIRPIAGSSTSVDPIGMLRGAPNPQYAHAFIEFVLSKEGQKLWDFLPGTPGGPRKTALRRLPIRKDLYTEDYLPHFADPQALPYQHTEEFTYHPEHTKDTFSAIRFIIRVMCIDTHDELRAAYATLIQTNFPPKATDLFYNLSEVNYGAANGSITETLRSRDKVRELRLAQALANSFRVRYRKTIKMANRGE